MALNFKNSNITLSNLRSLKISFFFLNIKHYESLQKIQLFLIEYNLYLIAMEMFLTVFILKY